MKQWLIEQNAESLTILAIATVLGLFAFYLIYKVIRQLLFNHKIESQISSLGWKQLRDIIIDDGMDGKIQVERVFLTARGIMALSSNFLTGNIFGDDKIDTWAQVIGKRTYRFQNPLYNFEYTLAALKHHFNDIPVHGKILFVGECAFPTGQPLGALLISDLEKYQYNEKTDEISEQAKELWRDFENSCEQGTQKIIELPGNGHLKKKLISSVFLLILSAMLFYYLINK